MAKPQLKKVTPFDANKEARLDIAWSGTRAYSNRIIISDSNTLDILYDQTVTTFLLSHTIPAYTLKNGKKYLVQCQVLDEQGTPSPISDKVLIRTFETPEFYFRGLEETTPLETSSYPAFLHYYSPDWEDIGYYKFYLYDSTKKLLHESRTMYPQDEFQYVYKGLQNNTHYYIRCLGSTENGMALDTGYLSISVKYENPNQYARLYATNDPVQGCIHVATNLVVIQYNGTESFEYEDGMINLIGKTLYYDKGFHIKDDFTVILRGINLYQTAEIFRMGNGANYLTLSSRIYNEGKLRFKLTVPNGCSDYILYSEEQVFENEDMVTVCIRRKNNLYQLKVFLEIGFHKEGNMWYGTKRPNEAEERDIWVDINSPLYMVLKETMQVFLEEKEPNTQNRDDLWIGGA